MRTEPTIVIVGRDVAVAEWVRLHLPDIDDWGQNYRAIGIARGGELLAGVVYNNLRWPSIEASIASIDASWCSRRNLAAIFAYPFRQLGCRRLGAMTEAQNQPARAFLSRLGFRPEGRLKQALRSGDAVLFGMTPDECRWLRNKGDVEGSKSGPAAG